MTIDKKILFTIMLGLYAYHCIAMTDAAKNFFTKPNKITKIQYALSPFGKDKKTLHKVGMGSFWALCAINAIIATGTILRKAYNNDELSETKTWKNLIINIANPFSQTWKAGNRIYQQREKYNRIKAAYDKTIAKIKKDLQTLATSINAVHNGKLDYATLANSIPDKTSSTIDNINDSYQEINKIITKQLQPLINDETLSEEAKKAAQDFLTNNLPSGLMSQNKKTK